MLVGVEYDDAQRDLLKKLVDTGILKKHLREEALGSLSFPMFAPGDDAPRKSRDKYKAICDSHAAANLCLASCSLMGVQCMDQKVEVETAPEGYNYDEATGRMVPIVLDAMSVSLKDILMGLEVTIHNGEKRALFNSLSQDENGEWDALFPGDERREDLARRIAAHACSWMLYHLAIKLRATEEGTTGFLKVAFLDSHVRLALNYSSWDAETESVSLDVSPVDSNIMEEDVELAELRRAEAEWIDLSPLDLVDRNVQQAEDQAQRLFAQDEAIDVSSLNTEQFFAGPQGRTPTSTQDAGRVRGFSGLRQSSGTTFSGDHHSGPRARQ